jgi:hypothetical protein
MLDRRWTELPGLRSEISTPQTKTRSRGPPDLGTQGGGVYESWLRDEVRGEIWLLRPEKEPKVTGSYRN